MSNRDDENLNILNIMEMELWHKLESSPPILSKSSIRCGFPITQSPVIEPQSSADCCAVCGLPALHAPHVF